MPCHGLSAVTSEIPLVRFWCSAVQVLLHCQLGWQVLMLATTEYSGADCLWPIATQTELLVVTLQGFKLAHNLWHSSRSHQSRPEAYCGCSQVLSLLTLRMLLTCGPAAGSRCAVCQTLYVEAMIHAVLVKQYETSLVHATRVPKFNVEVAVITLWRPCMDTCPWHRQCNSWSREGLMLHAYRM